MTQNTRLPGFFNHKRAAATSCDDRVPERRRRLRAGGLSASQGRRRLVPIRSSARKSQLRSRLPSNGQSGISRRCRRQLLANTATSIRFASAAGSSEDSRWTTTRRYTCCRSGTRGASRHGPRPSCSTSFVVLLGTGASQLAGCFEPVPSRFQISPVGRRRHVRFP